MIQKFEKYKQNLLIKDGNEVWSYTTKVAIIHDDHIQVKGYWSRTTTKHINYVAKEYNLEQRHYD
tara:strand:+ start:28533 stop:28727 length:195 start_codon:yes stop_codon:yes gene_type:complete